MILSDRFVSLNPLVIDEFRAVEVFKMVKRLNIYNEANQKQENKAPTTHLNSKGKQQSIVREKKRHRVKITD